MQKTPKLDQIDVRILAELQRNGRMGNNDLAYAVGLSASPCLQRVRRLEAAGYITGYHAQLNLFKFCEPQVVFTQITLNNHHREDFLRFENALREMDEVLEVHLVSGGFDYLVKFVTSGISEYQTLIDELLGQDLGINKYFSFIVLKSPIIKHEYPLKAFLHNPKGLGSE
ncbi:MAG TPA: Lrp/AsnC family transcriptional regulator [Holophaga sp.]|nr:Lrp/AsnC family transcriptional regulator [Holophaga sp.]